MPHVRKPGSPAAGSICLAVKASALPSAGIKDSLEPNTDGERGRAALLWGLGLKAVRVYTANLCLSPCSPATPWVWGLVAAVQPFRPSGNIKPPRDLQKFEDLGLACRTTGDPRRLYTALRVRHTCIESRCPFSDATEISLYHLSRLRQLPEALHCRQPSGRSGSQHLTLHVAMVRVYVRVGLPVSG